MCTDMRSMAQDPAYDMTYEEVWDAYRIFGCKCDPKFQGNYNCVGTPSCPTGDDPMTTGQANEIQFVECDLENDENKKTDFVVCWRGACTEPISWSATKAEFETELNTLNTLSDMDLSDDRLAIEVTFLESAHETACAGMYNATSGEINEPQRIRIEFKKDFGDLEPLEFHFAPASRSTFVSGHHPTVTVTCKTESVWKADRCSGTTLITSDGQVLFPVMGTKEEATCSNRGVCVDGGCVCDLRFASSDGEGNAGQRGDCGFKLYNLHVPESADTAQISMTYDCVGEFPCSGHGMCSGAPEYICSCFGGWTGPDCADRSCPSGRIWFGPPHDDDASHRKRSECSNRGICDRSSGTCVCQPGFGGAACAFLTCPTGVDYDPATTQCSGHGRCLFMWELAQAAGQTYGSEPNNPLTWDFDKTKGCYCDQGWGGIACDKRLCPSGDNPLTPGVPEIQRIACSARFVADDGASAACYSGPVNDRLALNLLRIRGEIVVANYYFVGNGACRDGSQLEPNSYSRTLETADDCAGRCSDIGADCEGFSFCTGIGWYPTNVSTAPNESPCTGRCVLYSSSRPQGAEQWLKFEPQMPVGVPQADPIGSVSLDEPWWQCYSKHESSVGSGNLQEPAIENIELYVGLESALSACAASPTCETVAGLYPHELPVDSGGVPEDDDGNGPWDVLYAALPSEASELSPHAQEQKSRETYEKRVGSECTIRVGAERRYEGFVGRYEGLRDFYDVGIFAFDRDRYDGNEDLHDSSDARVSIAAGAAGSTAAAMLQTHLRTLRLSAMTVNVEPDDSAASVCPLDGSSNVLTIEFSHSRGNLPPLDVTGFVGLDVSVTTTQQGTYENVECSDRGTCDYSTGVCACFPQFASSDGRGGPGSIRDCGHARIAPAPAQ
eukprot:g406.t1